MINRRTQITDLSITENDPDERSVFDTNPRDTRGRSCTSEDTLENTDVHENTKMSVIGHPTVSLSGVTVFTPIQSSTTEDTASTSSTSTATENETGGQYVHTAIRDGSSPLGEHGGSRGDNKIQRSRGNMEHRSTSDVFWDDKIQNFGMNAVESEAAGVKSGHRSTQDFSVANDENDVDVRINDGSRSVQPATIRDSEGQSRPSQDMAIETSPQCDREVQTGPSDEISLQTGDRSVQTGTNDSKTLEQTRTSDDNGIHAVTCNDRIVRRSFEGGSEVQTDSQNDMGVQTSTRCDRQVQTGQHSVIRSQTETEETIVIPKPILLPKCR